MNPLLRLELPPHHRESSPFSRFTLWKYRSRCLAAADNLFSLCLFFLWTGGRRRNNKNYEFDKLFLKAIEDETKFYKFKSLWQSNLDSPKVHTINHPWNSYHLLVNMQMPQRWNGGFVRKTDVLKAPIPVPVFGHLGVNEFNKTCLMNGEVFLREGGSKKWNPLCHLLGEFFLTNFAHLSSTVRGKTCFEFMSIFDMGVGVFAPCTW